ncbi:MAG: hypothetical protein PG978_000814 [Wolbachia endosymbiont of Ctenocephalides felis wCfeF]|nr:MAG: hypothetical protein PG978_000814 [Wolbachia endosymbiont of Ctenocephalides felis wCfeF]
MGTTLKNAADDTAFISALMALDDFKNKVYTKANEDDNLPNFSTFVTKTELEAPAVVRKILTTNSGEKDGDREITVLEKEVAKKPVAEAVLGVEYTDSDSKTRSVLVEKLGNSLGKTTDTYKAKYDGSKKQTAKDFLAEKSSLVKTDGTNATKELAAAILTIDGDTPDKSVLKEKVTEAPVAGAILGATSDEDGKKSILVEKLGTFLPGTDKVYEGKEAKAFLESKGLGSASADPSAVATELVTNKATALGTAILGVTKKVNNVDKPALETDLAGNETFQTSVAGNSALKTAVTTDTTFKNAVTSTLASPTAIAAVPTFKEAVATQLLTGDNKTALAAEVAGKDALKTAVTTDTTFKNAVTSTLAKPAEIAAVPALKEAVAANTDLRTAVKSALASDKTFQGNVKIEVNSEEPGFQGAVRGVMSKPVFEIPADENAPLSWDWI